MTALERRVQTVSGSRDPERPAAAVVGGARDRGCTVAGRAGAMDSGSGPEATS